ncbi:LysM peptidoglycan-binding domain-containing protein [Halobacillus salinarum]|uniref:LysM peptidoglycan-binding domain-containing protein n=1 Tax=Halobacillus salinarum TaxID=2932257 RepID=A0ABY4EJ37_9BACI|nr:LysM peptidoglycan-binding domain-containing protein [Halobacillus salinarum]UOQ44164.1 LysM peptidoglycan-binding domain-containing protein [Halobacillus salinarum]
MRKNGPFVLLVTAAVIFSFPFATFAASSQLITKGSTSNKVAALTFDDGADGANIHLILDVLDRYQVPATFFLTGQGTENHPHSVRDIADAGHEIGNHSYSHADFSTLNNTEIKQELNGAEAAVNHITGHTTKPLFRAPYGSVNASVLNEVGSAGYAFTIQWTIDTLDWKGLSSEQISNRIFSGIQPGAIVLMHTGAGAQGTPAALPGIIHDLEGRGYQFVTVGQLLTMREDVMIYTVKSGDTLYGIAGMYGLTVRQLAEENHILNPSVIQVGQMLTIPFSSQKFSRYTVQRGDTLYRIAVKYGVSVKEIAELNQLADVSYISVGQVLWIPSSSFLYTVKPGDTLYSLAKRFGTSVEFLAASNHIANPALIIRGSVLRIPK